MLSNTLLVNRNLITGSYYYYRPALSVIQGFTVFGHTSLITFGGPKNGLDSGAPLSMVKLVLNIFHFFLKGSLLSSTRERKFLAYQLIEKLVLPSFSISEVGVVLTPTLFRQIHTSTRVMQHSLYEASTHLVGVSSINYYLLN